MALQRHPALPRNEIVLPQQLGLREPFSARDLDADFEQLPGALWNVRFARNDSTRIEVDNVSHVFRERGVRRDLDHRSNRISRRRAQAGGEKNEVRARSGLSRDAFHVITRCT